MIITLLILILIAILCPECLIALIKWLLVLAFALLIVGFIALFVSARIN